MAALRTGALLVFSAAALCAQWTVAGRVVDENGAAVAGARVELRGPGQAAARAAAVSDEQGRIRIDVPGPGVYRLRAEREGYFVLDRTEVEIGGETNELNVVLNHVHELVESVDVVYSPPAIDPGQPSDQRQLNNVQVQAVPYPASQDVRRALPLFGGVVQAADGEPHVNGGAADQTAYTLNGFNMADPVTGRMEARVSIEAVRGLELEGSRIPAARGRGSAGSVDLETAMGDDRFRAAAANFVPSFSTERGLILNKWTPRASFSGPIARGRAWFHEGFDAYYDVDTVPELPQGQDRSRDFTTSNLFRLQVNLSPSHILTASHLWNYTDSDYYELSFLAPAETTRDRRRSLNMGAVRDQIYLAGGTLLDVGFAATRTVLRESPQGNSVFEITPSGYRGNYFADRTRVASRQQWTADAHFQAMERGGTHRVRAGADLERSAFDQLTARHEYRVLRTDGSVARSVTFLGDGARSRRNFQTALYVQDQWTIRTGPVIELGARADWDQIIRNWQVSPRVSLAWSPGWLKGVKAAAGFGVFSDPLNLEVLTRPQDQASVTQCFTSAGAAAGGPLVRRFVSEEATLRVARARVYSLSLERALPWGFQGKAAYLRRTGWHGLTYDELPGGGAAATLDYALASRRQDRYDAFELSTRRSFAGRYEWFVSYTYSRARSNAIVDYQVENPVFGPQAGGPLNWDAPHRLVSWGWAPVPAPRRVPLVRSALRQLTVSYLFEAHTGFPFSVVNQENYLVGPPNQRRLPDYVNLNLHFEKKFGFWRYQWAWRFGLNNVTNHGNPNVVNNNIDSPSFLAYGRGQRRAFNARLRYLGRR